MTDRDFWMEVLARTSPRYRVNAHVEGSSIIVTRSAWESKSLWRESVELVFNAEGVLTGRTSGWRFLRLLVLIVIRVLYKEVVR